MSDADAPASIRVPVEAVSRERIAGIDLVTVEEPLEIRVGFGPREARREQSLAVTMRTPGDDLDLAAGFLVGEGVVSSAADVEDIRHQGEPSLDKGLVNVVKVELAPGLEFDPEHLSRHTFTTSSCGICGKASLDAVRVLIPAFATADFAIDAAVLQQLPLGLTAEQTEFSRTGGLHAAAVFDDCGNLERIREDVGRHNALDKLIGSYLPEQHGLSGERGVLRGRGLLLSGRASFELVQKAAMVGIPLIAAIGSPSSLAIELAEETDMSLIGFLKSDRFNVYCGADRLAG